MKWAMNSLFPCLSQDSLLEFYGTCFISTDSDNTLSITREICIHEEMSNWFNTVKITISFEASRVFRSQSDLLIIPCPVRYGVMDIGVDHPRTPRLSGD